MGYIAETSNMQFLICVLCFFLVIIVLIKWVYHDVGNKYILKWTCKRSRQTSLKMDLPK